MVWACAYFTRIHAGVWHRAGTRVDALDAFGYSIHACIVFAFQEVTMSFDFWGVSTSAQIATALVLIAAFLAVLVYRNFSR